MLKFMLDTNIVIYVIKHRPVEVAKTFNEHTGQMCISSITLAELWYGVEKSQQQAQNRDVIEDFISRLDVVQYDDKAAAHYGDIRAELERKGRIIGSNELLIAAHARSQGLVLVTNNLKEFKRVDGLRSENWA
ncbi:MAG: tRNA(fMet)-specific endonuclease VapC [Pseudomonadales bacterium]